MGTITLTRQELYERVWSASIERLAKVFGLSGRGLGKLRTRYQIPRSAVRPIQIRAEIAEGLAKALRGFDKESEQRRCEAPAATTAAATYPRQQTGSGYEDFVSGRISGVSRSHFDRGTLCPTYSKPFDLLVHENETGDWR